MIHASSDCRWSPRIPQLPHYSSRQHRTWWLLRKEALHDAENHLQLERWVFNFFLFFSSFNCTLAQAALIQNSVRIDKWDSMSLLTNKTWRGSTLTDWNVLIILLPCKKTWEHSLKTRLGRISTLICGQSTHLPYKAAVIVVPDWHWILSHRRENSGNILVPGFLNPSMSGTQG